MMKKAADMGLDKLSNSVERGRKGENLGLKINMPRLSKYTNGIVRGRYILIGAESGVGKSTYVDAMMLSAIDNARDAGIKNLLFMYWSFEMSAEMKYATWIQYIAWTRFGVLFTADYLMGRVRGKQLTDEHYEVYKKCMKILEHEYLPYIQMIDMPVTPAGLLNRVVSFFENPEVGIVHRAPSKNDKPGRILGFTPSHQWQNGHVIGIVDHLALGTPETGQDTKKMIDAFSRYFVITRNLFDMSWLPIQQFNTEMSAANRTNKFKSKPELMIAPQRLDFGDSKYTFRDADAVIGLIAPNQFDLKTYVSYDVEKLGDFLVIAHLMKNRYGPAHKIMPVFMDPLRRTFEDLPAGDETGALTLWYEEAQKLSAECQSFFQKEDSQQS